MKIKTAITLIALFWSALCLAAPATLLIATTTSVDNTGLLDYLAPQFRQATGIQLKWTATGTGKALALGRSCDVSALLVHAPSAELAFMRSGYGIKRTTFMHNSFVIVGPKTDPANIKGLAALPAMAQILKQRALFISRGDNSGTNMRELQLWHTLNFAPPARASWYLQTGQGMLATLLIATEKHGYTLTDRGTYLKYAANYHHKPPLIILASKGRELLNKYSVILVNPKHCPNTKDKSAERFLTWITSTKTKTKINNYKLLGQQLFLSYAN